MPSQAQASSQKRKTKKKNVYIKTDIRKLRHEPKELYPNTIHIFTDGSCWNHDKSGGWGAVLLFNDKRREISGGRPNTTNNQMELQAILEALKAVKDLQKWPIIVYSDSQYCINCVTIWSKAWARNNWMTSEGSPVKNAEVIREISALITPNIVFKWVKGHIGNTHNERADVLAGEGRKQYGYV